VVKLHTNMGEDICFRVVSLTFLVLIMLCYYYYYY